MKAQGLTCGNSERSAIRWCGSRLILIFLALLAAGAAQALEVPGWPLNDTGSDWWANAMWLHLAAPPDGFPGQDASLGRDATHNNATDGHAGFSFTKLDAAGRDLAAGAPAWSCVRDNVTGLIWEVKPDDGGLRDRDWTYSWYNTDNARNGGGVGVRNGGSCGGAIACDTLAYAEAVNRSGLCGMRDWRLPYRNELLSIADFSRRWPAIDADFFPDVGGEDINNYVYWSASPHAISNWTPGSLEVLFVNGYSRWNGRGASNRVRLVRGGRSLSPDDHSNSRAGATVIAVDSRTTGRINAPGDNDYFRVQIGTAGTLTVYTAGSTDTYGYLLNAAGSELTRNDNTSTTNRNFRLNRTVSPGTYYIRVRHASITATGAYTLMSAFTATNGTVQRAVLLLHGMNSAPDTWNALVSTRWSGQCPEVYAGVAPAPAAALPRDALGAACYRLRFGRYDASGATGLEGRRCSAATSPSGCKGDFTNLYAPTGTDLGVEIFAAVRAIQARLGSDTQVVLLGHSRGGLAARAFLERPVSSAERAAVVGLVTTGTPHRGAPLARIHAYLRTSCLDANGRRITGRNRAGKPSAQWSACEDDWEAVDFLDTGLFGLIGLYLGKPTIAFLATGSTQVTALNTSGALANLPAGLCVVRLRYAGQYLGHLASGYSAWNRPLVPQAGPQFSARSRNYALCGTVSSCTKTENESEFNGDGIVPKSAQDIPGLANVPGLGATWTVDVGGGVYHTGEPGRTANINTALGKVTWR